MSYIKKIQYFEMTKYTHIYIYIYTKHFYIELYTLNRGSRISSCDKTSSFVTMFKVNMNITCCYFPSKWTSLTFNIPRDLLNNPYKLCFDFVHLPHALSRISTSNIFTKTFKMLMLKFNLATFVWQECCDLMSKRGTKS
jgi:hypothetical protein